MFFPPPPPLFPGRSAFLSPERVTIHHSVNNHPLPLSVLFNQAFTQLSVLPHTYSAVFTG
jgi:hypothetical protein